MVTGNVTEQIKRGQHKDTRQAAEDLAGGRDQPSPIPHPQTGVLGSFRYPAVFLGSPASSCSRHSPNPVVGALGSLFLELLQGSPQGLLGLLTACPYLSAHLSSGSAQGSFLSPLPTSATSSSLSEVAFFLSPSPFLFLFLSLLVPVSDLSYFSL